LIMSDRANSLGVYTLKDRFPFPYFVFTEKRFNVTTKRFDILALDPTDYTAIKFAARHSNNNGDIDDHTLDNIYLNLTSDGGGVYHYEWAVDDIDIIGEWFARIEFERADTKKFHHPTIFRFTVERKMPGSYGDI